MQDSVPQLADETWYSAEAGQVAPSPALVGTTSAEVCIIGGGMAGLWTAFSLAKAGRSVVVLEAGRIGQGASGRNGGFVFPGFALGLETLVAKAGLATAQSLVAQSLEGFDAVRAFCAENSGIRMGSGVLVVKRTPDPDGFRKASAWQAKHFGLPTELLDTAAVRSLVASPRYFQGLLSPQSFHLQPLKLVRALAARIAELGGSVYEHSPALTLETSGLRTLVRTASGTVGARQVVVCTNAARHGLAPTIERAVLPVATYVAVTEKLGQRLATAVRTEAAIADTRRAGDYYRIVDGDRLLWGGRITTARGMPSRLADKLRADMLAVYPQLASDGPPRMTHAWAGEMAYALHKMPIIDQPRDGLWVATAFGGHGLNTTAMAGLLIARAITVGDDAYRRFASFGAPWAGGPLGRAGVQLSYWGMQARDAWEERRSV